MAKFTPNKLRIRRRYQIYTVQCLQLILTCKLCLQYRHVHFIKVYPHFCISEQIKLNKNAVHHATTCSSMLNQLSWSSVLTFRLATGHDWLQQAASPPPTPLPEQDHHYLTEAPVARKMTRAWFTIEKGAFGGLLSNLMQRTSNVWNYLRTPDKKSVQNKHLFVNKSSQNVLGRRLMSYNGIWTTVLYNYFIMKIINFVLMKMPNEEAIWSTHVALLQKPDSLFL
jgi:hypothetical protein